jgi:hypothetical protein
MYNLKWFVAWYDEGERHISQGYEDRNEAKTKMNTLKESGFNAWMFPKYD